MKVFLAAVIVFGLAFLAMALSVLRKKQTQCLGCSCKAANRVMREAESIRCGSCSCDSE